MKRIKLSQGKVALIDAEDFKKVSAFSWYASKSSTHHYAKRFQGKTPIYLHRFLMSAKKGNLLTTSTATPLTTARRTFVLFAVHKTTQIKKEGKTANLQFEASII